LWKLGEQVKTGYESKSVITREVGEEGKRRRGKEGKKE
jgi:hypothetical protein